MQSLENQTKLTDSLEASFTHIFNPYCKINTKPNLWANPTGS